MADCFHLLFEPKASDSAHGLFPGPGMFPEDSHLSLTWTDLMLGELVVQLFVKGVRNRAHPRGGAPPTGVFQICHKPLEGSAIQESPTSNLSQ